LIRRSNDSGHRHSQRYCPAAQITRRRKAMKTPPEDTGWIKRLLRRLHSAPPAAPVHVPGQAPPEERAPGTRKKGTPDQPDKPPTET
jgi:hypothetical protein